MSAFPQSMPIPAVPSSTPVKKRGQLLTVTPGAVKSTMGWLADSAKEMAPVERKIKLERMSIGTRLESYLERLKNKGCILDPKQLWLCGGAIRRAVCGHAIDEGDFDIYVANGVSFDLAKAAVGLNWIPGPDSKKGGIHTYNFIIDNLNVQFHFQPFKTLAEIIGNFDFTCCQMAFDGESGWQIGTAVADAREMKLVYTGVAGHYTSSRAFRFISMGFKPAKGFLKQMETMAAQPVHESLGITPRAGGRS